MIRQGQGNTCDGPHMGGHRMLEDRKGFCTSKSNIVSREVVRQTGQEALYFWPLPRGKLKTINL